MHGEINKKNVSVVCVLGMNYLKDRQTLWNFSQFYVSVKSHVEGGKEKGEKEEEEEEWRRRVAKKNKKEEEK